MRLYSLVFLVCSLLAGCSSINANAPVRPSEAEPILHAQTSPKKIASVEGITEYRLANGMRLVLVPDSSQAQLTVNITYFVGSRHEGYGEAGMAHLLEHMLFKGTPERPDMLALLDERGAWYSATTSFDRTNFFSILPASDENLEFVLALEADRMMNSTISADDLASEFSVVRNEFEQNENIPWAILRERMFSTAYLWHNYGRSTIGNRSDIERVPAKSLRDFYQRFYRPDNAMLVIAGRFDETATATAVQNTFGKIARPAAALSATYTLEPVQDGEREVVLRRSGKAGITGLLYHTVAGAHADKQALDAYASILTNEPSGRLYKELVASGLASRVWSMPEAHRERGTILFLAEVAHGKSLDPVHDKMIEIIESGDSIPAEDVDRYRQQSASQFDSSFADSLRVALELSDFAALGDWRMLFVNRDRTEALNAEQVNRVAQTYFKRSNRTMGRFVPTLSPDRVPLAESPNVEKITHGYKGRGTVDAGEAFDASVFNIEARTERVTLANGMRLAMLAKKTRGNNVQMVMHLKFGTEDELQGKNAVAALLAQTLMRGTSQLPHQALRDRLTELGAQIHIAGNAEDTLPGKVTVYISANRDSLEEVISLLAEILSKPQLSAQSLEIVRGEQLLSLAEAQADPARLGRRELDRQLQNFAANDVRYLASFDELTERVENVSAQELKSMHDILWGSDVTALAIAGAFDPGVIRPVIEKHFGEWTAKTPYARISMPYRESASGEKVLHTPDKKNAFVTVGHSLNLSDDHPDFAALQFISRLLGESRTSRLWTRLRSDEGLSYRVFSSVTADSQDKRGAFRVSAICAPENANKVMELILEEINRLVRSGVNEDELERYKKGWMEDSANQRAMDRVLVWLLADTLADGRTMTFYEDIDQRIMALTTSDLQRVLSQYLNPDRLFRIKAGDFP